RSHGELLWIADRAGPKTLLPALERGLQRDPLLHRDSGPPGALASMEETATAAGPEGLQGLVSLAGRLECRSRSSRHGDNLAVSVTRVTLRRASRSGSVRNAGHGRLEWRGRRRRYVVGRVDLKVLLDGRAELVARPTELAHGPAEPSPEVGELFRPEDEQGQDHDDEELLDADVQHGLAESYTMVRACAPAFRPSLFIPP